MKLFYTNSSAKEEIGNLEARITTLETEATTNTSEITRLTAELATANGTIATLTTERDEAASAFEASEQSLTKANADLAAANTKLGTFDAEVESSAQAKFASLGGNPLTASEKHEHAESEMTRSNFANLKPSEKAEYLRTGGKLKD